jgi:ubiquinone/menaquinone biosynthesis C-methylase UbiE
VTDRPPPADWQLPAGVNRGLWDYLHSPSVARGYDAALAGSTLFSADEAFVARHCPTPGKLIDLGCGTGRLLLAFAARRYTVVGVDLSEEMLAVAREKATAASLPVHLVRANLAELDAVADGSFDHAACLFSTLGMVAGAETRRRVVRQVFRVLRPGGRFVLHVHNRWFNARDPVGRRWLLKNLVNSTLGRGVAGDREMPVHQGVAGLTLHLFTRREAEQLLREAGFRIAEVAAVGLGPDGRLPRPGWFGWLRAYGYLLAAEKPVRHAVKP